MYHYDASDQAIVDARVTQFRDQTARFLAGTLSEDEFRPLRLQNGLYIERHAPMLRIAIPYGMVSAHQMRTLARVARRYDRGFAHFTTRQNIQYNWVKLDETPDILAELAAVQMHAIQTSGSCIRNITTDPFAGAAADEIVDPRPLAELTRQWSTLHPEFAFLPRKFKVAFNGAVEDRAATGVHDLAFDLYRNDAGEVRVRVKAGGGQGRTPRIASVVREDLDWRDILSYSEALLRTYNRYGRRDNIFKARIKILVEALGPEQFAKEVEAEWQHLRGGPATLTPEALAHVAQYFTDPHYPEAQGPTGPIEGPPAFQRWLRRNVTAHKRADYATVTLSLKPTGVAPGDATADQMDAAAAIADRFSFGELRVTHHQNLALAHVARQDLLALWDAAQAAGMAEPNVGLATDVITCPGGDYCALANAKSIPLAKAIQLRLGARIEDIGDLTIKISGCINACGHHHVGHIGILGVDKHDEEWYQILIGGRADTKTALGRLIGKAVHRDETPAVVERIIDHYLAVRAPNERFIDAFDRLGFEAFRDAALASESVAP
jgi:sulfite reductase (NADPH) hemoprotein beta-component